MQTTLQSEILDRGRRERERTAYPEGFPQLTPVPAAPLRRRGVRRARAAARCSAGAGCSSRTPTSCPSRATTCCSASSPQPSSSCAATTARPRVLQHLPAPRRSGGAGAERQRRRRLVCGYHGWTYELDGTLVGLPSQQDFGEVDRECLGLRPVRCEPWGSFVFVNLDPDAEPLRDALGVVGHDLDHQLGDGDGVGPVHLVERRSIEVEGNWKLTVDANIETYHVNTVHRASAAIGARPGARPASSSCRAATRGC